MEAFVLDTSYEVKMKFVTPKVMLHAAIDGGMPIEKVISFLRQYGSLLRFMDEKQLTDDQIENAIKDVEKYTKAKPLPAPRIKSYVDPSVKPTIRYFESVLSLSRVSEIASSPQYAALVVVTTVICVGADMLNLCDNPFLAGLLMVYLTMIAYVETTRFDKKTLSSVLKMPEVYLVLLIKAWHIAAASQYWNVNTEGEDFKLSQIVSSWYAWVLAGVFTLLFDAVPNFRDRANLKRWWTAAYIFVLLKSFVQLMIVGDEDRPYRDICMFRHCQDITSAKTNSLVLLLGFYITFFIKQLRGQNQILSAPLRLDFLDDPFKFLPKANGYFSIVPMLGFNHSLIMNNMEDTTAPNLDAPRRSATV